jgi:DNA-binding MarR family transcriptional regulator
MAETARSIATQCNSTSLRKASRKISQLYDQMLAPSGIKGTQYAIFAELNRYPKKPPTMQALARALVLDRSALGHNLRPLERDGFIEIVIDPNDRRSRVVKLTAAGLRLFRKATPHWQKAQSVFENAFTTKTSAELRKLLQMIAGARFQGVSESST